MSFQDLRPTYHLPASFQFRYWQLRHALNSQFPDPVTLESDSIKRLLISGVMGKPFSSLYLYLTVAHDTDTAVVLGKWSTDIPDLNEEVWEDCVPSYVPSMIASRGCFIQLQFLHRAHPAEVG